MEAARQNDGTEVQSDERWTADDEQQILDTIERWADKELKPIAMKYDQADEYPHEVVDQMKELGLFGATVSPEYGGLGLSATTYAKIVSAVCRVWMAPTGIFNSHLILANCIERFGTESQKAEFLPKLAAGEWRGGIALTEPSSGTDLQGMRSTAIRDGDHYVVNGAKTWITNSKEGNCVALLVKTDPHAVPAHKGMSMFIAEKGPGFEVSRKLKKLGYKAIDTAELVFDDYRVPVDRLIGGKEGRGFHHAVSGLELGRINIAARAVGIAQSALDNAVRYAQERITFGKPIHKHQAIQLKLGDMATRVEAARLLTHSAAEKFDLGQRCDMEAGMAKLFASEAGLENATEAMRIFGAYGYSAEFEIERLYRDAPLMCIGEGTNEMQRIIIAKQLIERNKI